MAVSKRHSPVAPVARDLKQRVFTCISKLSDRDTQAIAVAELEAIAIALSPAAVPSFISCLYIPDAATATKSPVRTHCVRLLSLLSRHHQNTISPSLPKMLVTVLRRLRDPDSSVRSACIDAVSAMASQITSAPFSSFLKPLTTALFTEQDINAQMGSALCLAAAVDAAPDPEPLQLQKLIPKIVKLLKCNSFKAKPALLTLVGSVIGAGGASSANVLKNLVPCIMESVSSEDWAARKAAAEAFVKLAVAEADMLSEFKPLCLKKFENRRYDKVKAVRDTMNQVVEVWKEIPDVTDELTPPPQSHSSSKENFGGGSSPADQSEAPYEKKKNGNSGSLRPSNTSFASSTRKRNVLQSTDNNIEGTMYGKLDSNNPSDWKYDKVVRRIPMSGGVSSDDDHKRSGERVVETRELEKTRFGKPDLRRVLFSKNPGENTPKAVGFKPGSRVVPSNDENSESTVCDKNDHLDRSEEREELSLIRKQLVQIENQQANILDLLQRFVGSSQNGMNVLETRVHCLERAVNDISYDVARMSNTDARGTTCCMLPGSDFLSSRFWRRTEGRSTSPGFSSSPGTRLVAGLRRITDRNAMFEASKVESRRFQLPGGSGGFIVNPLAELHRESIGSSDTRPTTVSKNVGT